MSFPDKFLFFTLGWKDLGEKCPKKIVYSPEVNDILSTYVCCATCGDKVHIGKQKDEIFMFCKRCLRVVKE